MKKQNILICILIMMLVLSACGNSEYTEETGMETGSDSSESTEETSGTPSESMDDTMEGETNEMASGVRMTREYVIEQGILTEEELVGIDFEAMAERYGWQEGTEEDWDIRASFMAIKDSFPLPGYGFDYSWLSSVTEQEDIFTREDTDQIKAIGFSYQSGNYYKCMIFDLVESKGYLGENIRLYELGAKPSREISLTDEQKEELKRIMRDNAVDAWNKRYEGTNGDTTGEFWWRLCYALEDGRIYSNSGAGVLGKSTPDTYDILEDGLEAFWKEEQ